MEVHFRPAGKGVADILPVKNENSHAGWLRRSSHQERRSVRVVRSGTAGFQPVADSSRAELPIILGASSLRLRPGSRTISTLIPLISQRRSTIFLMDTDRPEQILYTPPV